MSGVYTAGKAATNAAYNARTRKLMEESEELQLSKSQKCQRPLPVAQDRRIPGSR
jgi:hypothetical protein